MEAREAQIADLEKDPANTDQSFLTARPGAVRGNDIFDLSTVRASMANPSAARAELHERASRAVEMARFPTEHASREACQERVQFLLDSVVDPHGELARRILATGSPAYKQAFAKWIASGGTHFEASMQIGTDTTGGFAVPFELDPTVILTSNGAVNPYRSISRVESIIGDTWKGVSSAGVTATRRAESGEADDNTPTIGQPAVITSRVDVFIPFSIELQSSWQGMQGNLARMIQDAKDVEEATSFTTGNSTAPNPEGLLTGATITVTTATTAVFASGDLDKTEEALPPRFQPRAQWVANRKQYNLVRHFDDGRRPEPVGACRGGPGPRRQHGPDAARVRGERVLGDVGGDDVHDEDHGAGRLQPLPDRRHDRAEHGADPAPVRDREQPAVR